MSAGTSPAFVDPKAEFAEFRLIETLFSRHGHHSADVILGIGDDAALTRLPEKFKGYDLATVTDLLVEGTHFLPDAPARSVGHRCLAINLSDLAAIGAEPLWASLGLCIPTIDADWLDEFAEGFFALADRYGVNLIGGDTVKGSLSLSVTVQGAIPPTEAITRAGASVGELIFVTGHPGHAAAGRDSHESFASAFLYPEPKLDFGVELRGLATSMIDISDGLHTDLSQLMSASGTGAAMNAEALPLEEMLAAGLTPDEAFRYALFGGEDYELLFTADPAQHDRLGELAESCGVMVSCIGETNAAGNVCWRRAGRDLLLPDAIFRHFDEGE